MGTWVSFSRVHGFVDSFSAIHLPTVFGTVCPNWSVDVPFSMNVHCRKMFDENTTNT